MNLNDISKEIGNLAGTMKEGFKHINSKLDKMNDDVIKNEDDIVELKVKDAYLEGKIKGGILTIMAIAGGITLVLGILSFFV